MREGRSAGILLHVSSLYNRYPIGDLGPAAMQFVDFLNAASQHLWQVLPIGPTLKNHSPYSLSSAFAGNPLLISPDQLFAAGFLTKQDLSLKLSQSADKVDYKKARQFKNHLLKKAFQQFLKTENQSSSFAHFIKKETYWLMDYALFFALASHYGTMDWTRWQKAIRQRETRAILAAQKKLALPIKYYQFVQWQFALQWQALKNYCHKKKVNLVGDMPLFIAHQSVDVWVHQYLFKLDKGGKSLYSAGVPPDYFAKSGQIWHLPVYRWDKMKAEHYKWWRMRFQIHFNRFDSLRLDHFIGFIRVYEIPEGGKALRKAHYSATQGKSLLKMIMKNFKRVSLIAEDLGNVNRQVENLRKTFHLKGTKVLQFSLNERMVEDQILPFDFPKDTVVYTGTHDNNTARGWYEALDKRSKHFVNQALQANAKNISWAMIGEAYAKTSDWAIIPMQDFLNLSADARMNIPGKATGNWLWRLNKNKKSVMLNLALKIQGLTQTYQR